MRIEFLTKNYSASDKLKDLITKKVERLSKFFEDDVKVKILLKQSNQVETLELTVIVDSAVLRSEVSNGNMYENIDIALPKLEKQIIRHRERLQTKSKKVRRDFGLEAEAAPAKEEKKPGVVRNKAFELTPMTVEDAIDELEMVGHSFYVFANKGTRSINVLYRRDDGDYGLIEALV